MPRTTKIITLTETEEKTLKGLLNQSTIEARVYIRAKILLLKNEGYSNAYIVRKLDICRQSVRLCIDKYIDGGLECALRDHEGRGRKAEITDSDITWVINKACQKPKEFGYSAELWYPASFTRFINSIAEEEGHPRMATVTETTLRKIMANAKIRPFKVTYYCERRDPDFDSKMHDVLVIYKQISLQFDEEGNLIPQEGTPVHSLSRMRRILSPAGYF